MIKQNRRAFIDARDFDADGISILPSTKEVDDTLEEAYVIMPSNVLTLSRGLPLTSYTMGDTENLNGAERITTPSVEAVQGRTTRAYVPSNKNEPLTTYSSPVFIESDDTPKITSYKELKNTILKPKRNTDNISNPSHLGINIESNPSRLGINIESNPSHAYRKTETTISHLGVEPEILQNTIKNKIVFSQPIAPSVEEETDYHQLHKQRETFEPHIDEQESKMLVEHIQKVIDSQAGVTKEETTEDTIREISETNKVIDTDTIVDKLKYEFKTEMESLVDKWERLMAQQSREIDKQTRKNFEELIIKFLNS